VHVAHQENAHEHTGSAEAVRPSLRNGFTAYFVLSPVTGFLATVANELLRRLDASVGASGPHDFAVRFSAVRPHAKSALRHCRVHRIPIPRKMTIMIRPSFGTGRWTKRTDLGPESSDFRKIRKDGWKALASSPD
jgi:hypothetical protein